MSSNYIYPGQQGKKEPYPSRPFYQFLVKTGIKCPICLQEVNIPIYTTAKIKILLPKLSIHYPNSVYVAGFYTYAIFSISGTRFYLLHLTYYILLHFKDNRSPRFTPPNAFILQLAEIQAFIISFRCLISS